MSEKPTWSIDDVSPEAWARVIARAEQDGPLSGAAGLLKLRAKHEWTRERDRLTEMAESAARLAEQTRTQLEQFKSRPRP